VIAWLCMLALAAEPPAEGADEAPVEEPQPAAERLGPTDQVSASYVVKVASQEEARDALVVRAKELGGWFATLDDASVGLRVPVARVPELIESIESLGLVGERQYNATDVRERLSELTARIASRRELLDQYLELLAGADASSVLQLEREITATISQVESLEGQRRRLRDTATIARVHVMFQFRDRRRPGGAQRSEFPWMNTLAVEEVESDLRSRWHRGDKRTGLDPVAIDGFANYRMKRESRATSPDGVVVRTRAVRHKPKAELDYWSESIQTHLLAQGYVLLAEEELSGARWLEWGIPVGQEDHTYVVVVKPDGGRIELVEAAGPSEAFMSRRDAVLAGVGVVLR